MIFAKLKQINRPLLGVYGVRAGAVAGLTMVHLFLPIFLYELFGNNLFAPLVYFIFLHLLYGFLAPAGGILMNHIGMRTMLFGSAAFGILLIATLFILNDIGSSSPTTLFWLGSLVVTGAIFRVLYWVPMHIDFAKFTDRKKRGAQTGTLVFIITLVGVIAPIAGGYIIDGLGYAMLFVVGALVFLSIIFPIFLIPKEGEHYSWGYRETFRKMLHPNHRHLVAVSAVTGAENVLGVVVWPLFIFILLEGNYIDVGLISGVIVAVTAALQVFVGKYMDKVPKERVLRIGSVLAAIGWGFKLLIATAFQVFLVGIYHNMAKSFIKTSYNAFFYEIAADQGHYVDEFTILRETAIQFGKVAALLVVGAILMFFSLQWAFLVGVLAALGLNVLLRKDGHKEAVRVS